MTVATTIVRDWTLKRSGAGMTLTGKSDGVPVRLPDISTVRVEGGVVLAQSKGGDIYQLRTGA